MYWVMMVNLYHVFTPSALLWQKGKRMFRGLALLLSRNILAISLKKGQFGPMAPDMVEMLSLERSASLFV